ncbi:hypothetical protein EVA_10200 [gut metagenome]|uniref:Uncharacterized protein n=1 Tax=gut metagenome TaxID=749906 RepID=J9G4B2_9ZZZZ
MESSVMKRCTGKTKSLRCKWGEAKIHTLLAGNLNSIQKIILVEVWAHC